MLGLRMTLPQPLAQHGDFEKTQEPTSPLDRFKYKKNKEGLPFKCTVICPHYR